MNYWGKMTKMIELQAKHPHSNKYLLAKLQASFVNKTRGNFLVIGGESTNKEEEDSDRYFNT